MSSVRILRGDTVTSVERRLDHAKLSEVLPQRKTKRQVMLWLRYPKGKIIIRAGFQPFRYVQSQRKAAQQRLRHSKDPPGSPHTRLPHPLTTEAQRTATEVAVRRRAKYEAAHKGAFELVFPAATGSTEEACYSKCLEAARELFEGHHSKRNQNVLAGLTARRLRLQVRIGICTFVLTYSKSTGTQHRMQ
jgi:hypothetical protein